MAAEWFGHLILPIAMKSSKHPLGRQLLNLTLVCVFLLAPAAMAVIPDQSRGMPLISGVYQVVGGNDPLFPQAYGSEWFFDFGPGMNHGAHHGNVTVSLRQNPNVRVRIMTWQAFPNQHRLLLGNAVANQPNGAFARADWQVAPDSDGVVFRRGDHMLILARPAPGVY